MVGKTALKRKNGYTQNGYALQATSCKPIQNSLKPEGKYSYTLQAYPTYSMGPATRHPEVRTW
jgi:hypothetical protein